MTALAHILRTSKGEVLARWEEDARRELAPTLAAPELLDHLPHFLDELAAALERDEGLATRGATPDETRSAESHGSQRLRLGFSLDAVVREYGMLASAIVAVAADGGRPLSLREVEVLHRAVNTGIAHAVSEYARQRDAEQQRQANEHFAFVAHELRNPLSTALAALALLEHEGQARGAAAGALRRALDAMKRLVDESLEAARAASGVELRPETTSLRAILEEARAGQELEARQRDVALEVVLEHDGSMTVDLRLVRSALGNLVRNAVKYSCRGGVVELRGRLDGPRVCIEVEDCCGGIPEEDVARAFAPFVRVGGSGDGFGLGLAIAKLAADAHGGSIRVQNLAGKGCVFALELPREGAA